MTLQANLHNFHLLTKLSRSTDAEAFFLCDKAFLLSSASFSFSENFNINKVNSWVKTLSFAEIYEQ